MAAIWKSLTAVWLVLGVAACATVQPLPGAAAIDGEARRLMAAEDVKGMALALIDRGQVVHVAAYGVRNVERNLLLETDTVMYGASLTKAAVAYLVLRLADEGKIDLDKSIAEYLPKPLPDYEDYADLKGDERWRELTVRRILTHSTGFANFRWLEEDQKLKFHRKPGERYGYSGEGYYVLQTVLEDGLKMNLGVEMQRRLFDRFGMPNTDMQWRPDFAKNLADGYDLDGKFEPHDERSAPSAPGSMDTTIVDAAMLWAGMVRGDGLSKTSRSELVKPQLPIVSASQFPTLSDATDLRGQEIALSAGLGVVTFDGPQGRTWFKGGHNDWTGNMAVCVEVGQRCVVLLGNSVRAEKIYPALVRFILGDTAMPWWWEYGPG
ncbi:MAG: serine hydrolase domain-containing protein [Hyphomonadaceae bacterium]|nr:serine hydrolase domain-containing protein [Hyphomonadaceae bacterium]